MKIKETHKIGRDGRRLDGVSSTRSTIHDLRSYDAAKHLLGSMRVPILLHADAPHERLFLANFDGTGNDVDGDPHHMTNVGRFAEQLKAKKDSRISSFYVAGPGTQSGFVLRLVDGAVGYSHDERVEIMRKRLSLKVEEWLAEDPEARIRVVSTGFSRGGEEVMSFSRRLHDEGVSTKVGRDRKQLIRAGTIPQAVALFDPVATGHPTRHDRRVSPSVVAGFQVTAKDERRSQFPSSMIIPQGLSADRRLLAITVPGAHSDVGGSYHEDGLARASGNLMIDFIDGLSEQRLLERYQLYDDVQRYPIHRSEEHSIIYDTRVHDRLGARGVRGAQKGAPDCRPVVRCALPEGTSEEVLAQVPDRARVHVGEVPSEVMDLDLQFKHDLLRDAAPLTGRDRGEDALDIEGHEARPEPFAEPKIQPVLSSEGQIEHARDNRIEFSRFPWLEPDAPVVPAPTSPAHPAHRDHRLYNSIHDQLTTLHAEEGITLSDQQMERLAHCSVAQARRCGMTDVTHMSLGQDKQGNIEPEVHMYQAFRGDLDDPRTRWGKVDALEAFQTPVATASQDLQMANQQWEQMAQDRQMQLSQQQEQGMSMSR
ncbi:T6SS phospholipase effector Tle1-like catalytic domain-containing protein [Luteibacter aegosomatissinici]|uniref:T6SS phospholipase effector Tle1-like catalytic domain-containing protein n=1 Tax=Luteibacter aegosomatissinici TaxID=2911539 RepID=UPI001FFC2280|nr:DUF2235 domain-containing protein [Luteibacter aegosomatissinici]UPG93607.1 DUF2235 domain-containing protein [Luteibacter aegosomatissinici]